MRHAPDCEHAVVFLFGLVFKNLGFEIEKVQQRFPDCIAKRKTKTGEELVHIEFEFKSKNFNHDKEKCDIIVCWEDNWKGCPIEVIELKEEIKKLKRLNES